ncbi:hypothetical protein Tco_0958663, partial [Tanacetum coccineum]
GKEQLKPAKNLERAAEERHHAVNRERAADERERAAKEQQQAIKGQKGQHRRGIYVIALGSISEPSSTASSSSEAVAGAPLELLIFFN